MEFPFPDGPMVAVLSPAEAERLAAILGHVLGHAARGESARVDLRAAFVAEIGRDPFTGQV